MYASRLHTRRGTPLTHPPFEHRDYALGQLLGEGGQAQVFLARHRTLERPVAIKVLRANQDASMARRMLQEARLIASLKHPNLVQVFDAGLTESGRPYIVMELINGLSLSRWDRQHDVTPEAALELLWQVASGLEVAHRAGIVHRDIKPGNILIEDDDSPAGFCAKLLDFGVARPEQSDETAVGMVVGTIGYMAPEAFEGETLAASDVFSLGIILFRLLSGNRSARALEIRRQLQASHGSEQPWRTHPELIALISDMLSEEASKRPADGAGLVARLERLRPWSRFAEVKEPPTLVTPAQTRHATTPKRSLGLVAAVGAGAALVTLVGLVFSALCMVGLGTVQQGPSAVDVTSARPPAGPEPAQAVQPPASPAETVRTEPESTQAMTSDATSAEAEPVEVAHVEAEPVEVAPVEAEPVEAEPAEAEPAEAEPAELMTEDDAAPEAAAAANADPRAAHDAIAEAPAGVETQSEAADAPAPAPAPAPLLAGTYQGTTQGRPITLVVSGTAERLEAVMTVLIGARSEVHTMVGTATSGSTVELTAREPSGQWSIRARLVGDQLTGAIAIKERDRGRFETRRTAP